MYGCNLGGTSVLGVLFALPLLGAGRVGSRRPVRIELHVQLALASRQLIVLGLLLAAQRVPLNKNTPGSEQESRLHIGGHQEKRGTTPSRRTCEPGRPTHSALSFKKILIFSHGGLTKREQSKNDRENACCCMHVSHANGTPWEAVRRGVTRWLR